MALGKVCKPHTSAKGLLFARSPKLQPGVNAIITIFKDFRHVSVEKIGVFL
jgi:hypothetical protein